MDEKDAAMLRYLAEGQSLTRTAERLYVTQPALTYRLQQMEREFGVPLIVKHARGTHLTPEGEALAAHARRMSEELARVKDELQGMRGRIKGTLRLGVSSYFGLYMLPPLLKKFRDLYPEVQFDVTCALSSEVMELLHGREIHLGIVRGDYPWPEGRRLLHDEPICLIAEQQLDLAGLPALPLIQYSDPRGGAARQTPSSFVQDIQAWWRERYDEPPHVVMKVDAYETCREMVKHGLGYSFVPRVFVPRGSGLYTHELARLDGTPLRRSTWMLYREPSLELATVSRFIAFMQEEHGEGGHAFEAARGD
ncbi:LysR family transcriptional regulator [Paenibacillus physcomitrellae]|uniref:HTH-type transcriptional regulator YraN n=1 Tax=Paenibacillus physcomitrellae TaxID=1619311 RepID=A0ABQ1GY45_9BACL|nr:LysR family transcriptional regulator [Paenibacillus physcomitrellae]GGA52159.1 putative HTH-type transcriptional regulator YraN [Paenibacillus physcomitrellae]